MAYYAGMGKGRKMVYFGLVICIPTPEKYCRIPKGVRYKFDPTVDDTEPNATSTQFGVPPIRG